MDKTYTPEQQKENLRKAVAALRANERKAKGDMYDDQGGRCCLCVMSNVAEDIDQVERDTYAGDGLPLKRLEEVFGIKNCAHDIHFNFEIGIARVSEINDGEISDGVIVEERTHAEIADMIEKEFLS